MFEQKIAIIKLKGHFLGIVDIRENESWIKRYTYTPTEQEVIKDYNNTLRMIRRNLS